MGELHDGIVAGRRPGTSTAQRNFVTSALQSVTSSGTNNDKRPVPQGLGPFDRAVPPRAPG